MLSMQLTTLQSNMKTFKQYLAEKYSKLQNMVTSFGSHSVNEDSYEVKSDEEHEKIHKKLKIDKSVITPDHLGAVTRYSDTSSSLNNYLHKKSNDPSTEGEYYPKEANILTELLNTQKTKVPIDLYTGIKYSPAKHFETDKELPHSKIVHLPAFTSTSTKRSIAGRFSSSTEHKNDQMHGVDSKYGAKHIIKIHAPKGTSAASIKEHSFMPHEEEVLLNRGHDIRIESKPEHLYDDVYQWNAHIVAHNPQDLS